MSLSEWQELSPAAAAREVHHRAQTRLSPTQQRAVIASLESEPVLATAIEHARAAGRALGGAPYLVKDLFDVRGTPTLAGSTFLPEVRAANKDSTLINAANAAGLAFAGKTHLHEFAYGITGENPHYGDCEHPLAAGRTTGGSSSGSAAAVAAGIVPVAFGTDTGGSVRVPSAFCGLYGLRLHPADRWIRDAFPLARSFDTAGWFTSTAADMRTVTDALIGAPRGYSMEPQLQPRDSMSAAKPAAPMSRPLRGCYLPMPGVDEVVAHPCAHAATFLTEPGDAGTVADLQAAFADALFAYNTTVAIEAWEVHLDWAARYAGRYDPAVWQRLNRVHALTAQDLARADEIRRRVQVAWARYFLAYDFLVLPAAPTVALTKAECTAENRARLLTLTAPASLGGLPVLTLPVRLPDTPLTAGLQIVVNQPLNPAIDRALRVAEEQRGRIFV